MKSIQHFIGTHRNQIKGFAILWVVFFHAQLGLTGILYDVQKIGYGGVDLFLFLSGFGLYHSLAKNSDTGRYLMRRCRRLLPAYLPFCLVWLCVMIPLYGGGMATSLRIAAGNLSMFGFFANVPLMINWYVSMLALSLLLAPLFFAWLRHEDHGTVRVLALMAVCFGIGLAYVGNDEYMAVSRLPVFVLGMAFARPCQKEHKWLPSALAAGALAGFAALYACFARFPELLNDYAMYWHPFALIAPALCAGLGWLFARTPGIVSRVFAVLGRASFEIFLFNVWLEVLGKKYGLAKTPAEWLLWSLGTVVLGLGYHWLIGKNVRKVVDNHR